MAGEEDIGSEINDLTQRLLAGRLDGQEYEEELERLISTHKPPEYTAKRDLVAEIAATEPERALEIARGIKEPWFRCQALAYAAAHVSDESRFSALLADSFAAALEMAGEFNQIVSVSAWPLRVLCQKSQWDRVKEETTRLLEVIAQEPSPVRRASALLGLARALWDAPADLLRPVLVLLVSACLQPLSSGKRNRRGESWIVDALPAIYRCSSTWAEDVVERISAPAKREYGKEVIEKLKQGILMPRTVGMARNSQDRR